jgi:hypothetical protein
MTPNIDGLEPRRMLILALGSLYALVSMVFMSGYIITKLVVCIFGG